MDAVFQREDKNDDVVGNHKRFRHLKERKNPITCEVDFDGTLTSEACCKLLIETIKYVLYSRGQLPLQCDLLFKLYLTASPDGATGAIANGGNNRPNVMRQNSHSRKMKQTLENIKELLDRIEDLLHRNAACEIQEFLIIIGATPVSPKNTYNVKFPQCVKEYAGGVCPIRRCLVQMFRKLVMMEDLSGLPSVCPTNTYLFVKMRRSANEKWFVPKPDFKPLTLRGLWILFIFRSGNDNANGIQDKPVEAREMANSLAAAEVVSQNKIFEIFSEVNTPSAIDEGYSSVTSVEQFSGSKETDNSCDAVGNLASGVKQLDLDEERLEPEPESSDDELFIWFQAPIVIKGVGGEAIESDSSLI